MRLGTLQSIISFLILSLVSRSTACLELTVYRANGEIVYDQEAIGGLCLVRVNSGPDEVVTDLRVRAGEIELESHDDTGERLFWLPCQEFQGIETIYAEWRDRGGRKTELRKNIRIHNTRLKIRLEIPQTTPQERTIFATGNLYGLGMRPDAEWNPRFFALQHIGRGHWFASLMVGADESVELEFTMGGWGTKGRDKNNQVIHITETVPGDLEIATRIHSWGERTGFPDPRPPYLSVGDIYGDDIIVAFRADRELRSIRFGGSEDDLSSKRVSNDRGGSFLRMNDLAAGTRYFYQIERQDPIKTFQMPQTTDLTFHVIGDSKGTPDVLNSMYEHGVSDLIIDTGDLVYSGWDEDNWDASLKAISVVATRAPYMVAPGNHEEESPIFREVFHFPHEEYYYAFQYGPARFLILDSERPYESGTSQRAFLDSVLSAWRSRPEIPSFVAIHSPPYSNGKHGSDLHLRTELCPLFEKAGVDIVFSGHDHGYEATWPLAGDVRNNAGTVYVVCAGGGATLYDTREPRKPWSRLRFKAFHWITVDVHGQRISVRVMTPDGKLIDQFHSINGLFSLTE